MVYLHTKNTNLGICRRFWYLMGNFTAIWYILWQLGMYVLWSFGTFSRFAVWPELYFLNVHKLTKTETSRNIFPWNYILEAMRIWQVSPYLDNREFFHQVANFAQSGHTAPPPPNLNQLLEKAFKCYTLCSSFSFKTGVLHLLAFLIESYCRRDPIFFLVRGGRVQGKAGTSVTRFCLK
jgi:hypothetical protein